MSFETNLYHPMKRFLTALTVGILAASCAATDLMTSEQASEHQLLEAELQSAIDAQDWERAQELDDELSRREQAAVDPYVETAQTILSDFVPAGPWKPLALMGVGLASRAFTRRGRRHLKKGAASAARLHLPEVARSVGAALGYGSGSLEDAEQSLEDMRVAEEARQTPTPELTDAVLQEAIAVAVAQALAAQRADDEEAA